MPTEEAVVKYLVLTEETVFKSLVLTEETVFKYLVLTGTELSGGWREGACT